MAEKVLGYSRLCKRVMDLDGQIRFAGVINDLGRLVAGGMRPGVEPLETEKDDEMLYMELALRVRMRQEFDRQLGAVNFAMASRKRALTMSFKMDDHILYVAAEPDADYCTLPKLILGTLR
ncbi:MAG: hypothetical protein IS632_04440 [Thaumarchaeota archaeon]|nr:hypothetical protein [Nitrososphaerota archaeon]